MRPPPLRQKQVRELSDRFGTVMTLIAGAAFAACFMKTSIGCRSSFRARKDCIKFVRSVNMGVGCCASYGNFQPIKDILHISLAMVLSRLLLFTRSRAGFFAETLVGYCRETRFLCSS